MRFLLSIRQGYILWHQGAQAKDSDPRRCKKSITRVLDRIGMAKLWRRTASKFSKVHYTTLRRLDLGALTL